MLHFQKRKDASSSLDVGKYSSSHPKAWGFRMSSWLPRAAVWGDLFPCTQGTSLPLCYISLCVVVSEDSFFLLTWWGMPERHQGVKVLFGLSVLRVLPRRGFNHGLRPRRKEIFLCMNNSGGVSVTDPVHEQVSWISLLSEFRAEQVCPLISVPSVLQDVLSFKMQQFYSLCFQSDFYPSIFWYKIGSNYSL